MSKAFLQNKRTGTAVQLFLIFAWLAELNGTDSYYSVYALCAVAGTVCLLVNAGRDQELRPAMRRGMLALSCLFSVAASGANYPLFQPFGLVSLIEVLFALAGGVVCAYQIMLWSVDHLPISGSMEERPHPARVFWACFGTIAAIDLLYLFTAAYPGVLTTDSVTTVRYIEEGIRNNVMPFWHTETVGVFYRLGKGLFGTANAGVACYHVMQCLFMAACFAHALVTLYQTGVPKWCTLCAWAVYALLPYNYVYASTLWKDVIFGGAMLLFVTALYRSLCGIGKHRWANELVLMFGALGLCLWRTNGLMTYAAAAVVLILVLRKREKKLCVLLLSALAAGWLLTGPVLSALEAAPMDPVEGMAVPFQQAARVVANGRELQPEDRALLERAFDLEAMAEKYDPRTVDPVKFETFRRENLPELQENLGEYLSLYFRLGRQYPGDYLAAWVEETKGYWNGGYEFWRYTHGVAENTYGIEASGGGNIISSLFAAWGRLLETPKAFQPLFSIGFQVWLMIGCMFLNLWKKRPQWLLSVPLVVLMGGLWLVSPVFAEFRYAYPLLVSMPIVLGAAAFQSESK